MDREGRQRARQGPAPGHPRSPPVTPGTSLALGMRQKTRHGGNGLGRNSQANEHVQVCSASRRERRLNSAVALAGREHCGCRQAETAPGTGMAAGALRAAGVSCGTGVASTLVNDCWTH